MNSMRGLPRWARRLRASLALPLWLAIVSSSCAPLGPCAEIRGPLLFIAGAVDFESGEPLEELWIDEVRFGGERIAPERFEYPPDSGASFDGTKIVCLPPCEILSGSPARGTVDVELDLSAHGYEPRTMVITSHYETVETGPCGNYVEGSAEVVVSMIPTP
jgi:hypothetical protein